MKSKEIVYFTFKRNKPRDKVANFIPRIKHEELPLDILVFSRQRKQQWELRCQHSLNKEHRNGHPALQKNHGSVQAWLMTDSSKT